MRVPRIRRRLRGPMLRRLMRVRVVRRDYYPYEDTLAWTALARALGDLEQRGCLRLVDGPRPLLSALCGALDRAGLLNPANLPVNRLAGK